MHEEILLENLNLISESIDVVTKRFSEIDVPDDLVSNEYGILILDSVAMRLQVIGELLKKIHKGKPTLLENYSDINWRKGLGRKQTTNLNFFIMQYQPIELDLLVVYIRVSP